jgi:polyhydroxybutyrate depolymerase
MLESSPPGDHACTIAVGSLTRRYVLHVPPPRAAERLRPVLLAFHGGGGTAKLAALSTGWSDKADQVGFFVVYPEGIRPDPRRPATFLRNPPFWNVGAGVGYAERAGIDDVGFIRCLLGELGARLPVDPARVYATGFSNGASMAFQVAMELSAQIAAIAPVAGYLRRRQPRPTRPISMIYIAGAADPLIPLEGGVVESPWGELEERPPVVRSVETWAAWLGCPPKPRVVSDCAGVRRVRYGPGVQGGEVEFITIADAGHVWPGGPQILAERIAGKTTDKLSATDAIWEFFERQREPERSPERERGVNTRQTEP